MVHYNLTHLTQANTEAVLGPIQDTEALFLYALIRGMRMKRVLEIGGLGGYSARNFAAALESCNGIIYTVDINPVPVQCERHRVIQKNAEILTAGDLDNAPLDLIFFDCHVYEAQMNCFTQLVREGIITDKTIIALHDTNLHPIKTIPSAYLLPEGGWVHQPVERCLVNDFVSKHGYHAFSLHTSLDSHDASMPFRHGVSLLQKFNVMNVQKMI